MQLEEFIAQIERERPDSLGPSDLRSVFPKPWVLRAGSGKQARIRMLLGTARYERKPGDATWYRSDLLSDFDTEAA